MKEKNQKKTIRGGGEARFGCGVVPGQYLKLFLGST